MVTEGIPSQPTYLPVVLVPVITSMRNNEIGSDPRIELFQVGLYLPSLLGKEGIAERFHFNLRAGRFGKVSTPEQNCIGRPEQKCVTARLWGACR